MTDEDPFDAALRQQLHADAEPEDAGFSLRVMAALPDRGAPGRRRLARWVRVANWVSASCAASGAAWLSIQGTGPDAPHAVAALTLIGLLVFWSIPSRWSRG